MIVNINHYIYLNNIENLNLRYEKAKNYIYFMINCHKGKYRKKEKKHAEESKKSISMANSMLEICVAATVYLGHNSESE